MTNELARRYRVQVSTDDTSWLTVYGVNDLAPQVAPNKQDASDYENDGWTSNVITQQSWTLGIKYNQLATAGTRDAGQALIEAAVGQFGDDAELYVRWFDKTGLPEAKSGKGIVEVQRSKTGVADLAEMQVTITGQGPLSDISNPYAPASKPTLLTATPSAAGTGEQVTITGQGFTGATGVKFGAVAATEYTVLGDGVIVAVMPSGSAGAANITVTNATGTSDALSYTRAA